MQFHVGGRPFTAVGRGGLGRARVDRRLFAAADARPDAPLNPRRCKRAFLIRPQLILCQAVRRPGLFRAQISPTKKARAAAGWRAGDDNNNASATTDDPRRERRGGAGRGWGLWDRVGGGQGGTGSPRGSQAVKKGLKTCPTNIASFGVTGRITNERLEAKKKI